MADNRLIECVPNFSEGCDVNLIEQIANSISEIDGVALLDVDSGEDFNRTVITFVGNPDSVLEAALNCTRVALSLIDMRTHSGEHARMGAVDVVPFIPISATSIEDCVDLANRYAECVGEQFGIPVYLYAKAARSPTRVLLPNIRSGEYEGLEEKLSDPEWLPDEGPAEFVAQSGAIATGARSVLIAYNVNLNTDDKSAANKIAGKLRTSGVLKRNKEGEKIIGTDGAPERISGRFKALQGAGWMYDSETAQVSMNLLDYTQSGLHEITEAIRIEAAAVGLEITAGELVGLVPLQALLDAGKFYLTDGVEGTEDALVNAAINGLKLDVLSDFNTGKRVIEFAAGL